MKRVLLLTSLDPDLQTRRCVGHLQQGLGADFDFQLESASSKGLFATLGLAGKVRRIAQNCDVVHAFGESSLRLATLATKRAILYTPLATDRAKTARWLRSAQLRRNIRVISLSSGEDRLFIRHGVNPDSCRLVRPGVRMSRAPRRDDALREKLGLSPGTKLILAVGENDPHHEHCVAIHVASILYFINSAFRLLIWGRGHQLETLHRLHQSWGEDQFMLDATEILGKDVEFDDLIPAADIGLITAPDRLSLSPVLACMAAGLPLVGPATRPVSDLLEDRHTALLYSPIAPRIISRLTLNLAEDTALANKLADQARAEAYELFPVSRFLDEMRQIYSA